MSETWAVGGNMRCLAMLLLCATLAGCASDTAMLNPQTGQTVVCQEPLKGFDPWSQSQACVAQHEAQGWVISGSTAR